MRTCPTTFSLGSGLLVVLPPSLRGANCLPDRVAMLDMNLRMYM